MSTYWHLECERCQDITEGLNRGREDLIIAVEAALPLKAVADAGWDIESLHELPGGYSNVNGIAAFLVKHLACNSFAVVCEYQNGKYPTVRPVVKNTPHPASCKHCRGRMVIPCPECQEQ